MVADVPLPACGALKGRGDFFLAVVFHNYAESGAA